MARGYFTLILHAHLPFVRHPEDPTVMEERWLYEAITETYLPPGAATEATSSPPSGICRSVMGTTVPYAVARFSDHLTRFEKLREQLLAGEVDESLVAELEARDNIFPDLDYRIFAS